MIIITLLLVIVVILKARQPFQGPRGWPIVGHLPYLLQRDFHRVIRSWSDRYGAVYGMHVLGLPGFVVSDPASIGLVLCRTVDRPEVPKHTASYRELDVLWGGRSSIFTSDSNETWRLVRKSVASAFSSAMMREHFGTITDRCRALVLHIQNICRSSAESIDFDDASLRLTLDIISRVAFAFPESAIGAADHAVIKCLPIALWEIQQRMSNPFRGLRPPTEGATQAINCARKFEENCWRILAHIQGCNLHQLPNTMIGRQLLDIRSLEDGANHSSYHEHCMRKNDSVSPCATSLFHEPYDMPFAQVAQAVFVGVSGSGTPLSNEQIIAEIGTFLMGGLETTAHSLSFTLYCIAANPGVQEGIMQELIQNHLISSASCSTPLLQYDHLNHLRYLDAVLKESMRMYPAVTGFPRFTDRPLSLHNQTIPKGSLVYVSIYALHNSSLLWDYPDKFIPERWLSHESEDAAFAANSASSHGPVSKALRYLPFSNGPRSCIAQVMAMTELRAALAHLCSRFYFLPSASNLTQVDAEALETMTLTLQMEGGMHLHCVPRLHGTHLTSCTGTPGHAPKT